MLNAKMPFAKNDITPSWVDSCLRDAGVIDVARVVSVRAEPIGGGSGGSVYRVSLDYDRSESGAASSLIAKLPPLCETDGQRIMIELGSPVIEARFYSELANHAGIRTPRCYFSAYDPRAAAGALLIEDLGGMRLGNPGVSVGDAKAAVRALAKLHATMWNSPLIAARQWLDWGNRIKPYVRRIRSWLDRLAEQAPGGLDDRAATIIESALVELPDAMSRLSRPPVTLVHGDPWINNFAFDGPSVDDVALFDWQLAARMRPGFDIACFLDIVPEYRTFPDDESWLAETNSLVHDYYKALTEYGVTDYSLADLLADRKLARTYTINAGLWSQFALQELIGPEFEHNVSEWSRRLVRRTDALDRAGML